MTVLTLVKGKWQLLMMPSMSRMWVTEQVMEVNDLTNDVWLCCEQVLRCTSIDVVVELVEFFMSFFVCDAKFNIIYLCICIHA